MVIFSYRARCELIKLIVQVNIFFFIAALRSLYKVKKKTQEMRKEKEIKVFWSVIANQLNQWDLLITIPLNPLEMWPAISLHSFSSYLHNQILLSWLAAISLWLTTCIMYRKVFVASIILLPLLGLTWVFGLLAVNIDSRVFIWIFTVLNSLQVKLCCKLAIDYG